VAVTQFKAVIHDPPYSITRVGKVKGVELSVGKLIERVELAVVVTVPILTISPMSHALKTNNPKIEKTNIKNRRMRKSPFYN
jgi:hypothetical protein